MSELNFLDTGGNKQHITTPDINTLAFKTNMTERVRIGATGSVGIGAATPDETGGVTGGGLHIHGPENDNVRIRLTTPSKSNPGSLIGYYGLNRLGIDCYDGVEIRDVTASYATRFKIDQNGYRTIPDQPLFLTQSSGDALSANNDNPLQISSTFQNVGGHYKTSGSDLGKFVAPITGIYWFYCAWTPQGSYSGPVIGFMVNGSQTQNFMLNYNATYDGTFMGQTFSLSANDYVQCSMRDWNGSTPDPWNTWWGGWLQQ